MSPSITVSFLYFFYLLPSITAGIVYFLIIYQYYKMKYHQITLRNGCTILVEDINIINGFLIYSPRNKNDITSDVVLRLNEVNAVISSFYLYEKPEISVDLKEVCSITIGDIVSRNSIGFTPLQMNRIIRSKNEISRNPFGY